MGSASACESRRRKSVLRKPLNVSACGCNGLAFPRICKGEAPPGRLHERTSEPAVALSRPVAQTFTAALVIARAQSGPTGRMFRAVEHAQLCPEFRNQSPGGDDVHPGDRAGPLHHLRVDPLGNLGF